MKDEPIILNPPKKKPKTGKPRWKNNWSLVIFIVIFLALIVAVPYYLLVPKTEAFKLREYEIAQVEVRDFVKTVSATGTVVASEKLSILALTDGEVMRVLVKPGDVVKKGDLLIALSSDELRDALAKAQTQYQKNIKARSELRLESEQKLQDFDQQIATSRAQLERLKKEVPAYEQLFNLGEISRMNLEDERKKLGDAKQALADLEQQKQYAIERQRLDMEEAETAINESLKALVETQSKMTACDVRAGIDGKIISLDAKVGEEVKAGKTIAEIINEQSLMVEGKVELSDVQTVETGQTVKVDAGGQIYTGKVTYISPVADESKVKINVNFDQPATSLRPQATVNLDIETGVLKDRLALPRGRYLTSGDEKYVYKVSGKKAVKMQVTFGLVNDDYIELKDGLAKNDQIITSSYDDFIHLDEIQLNPEGGSKI